ncbi:CsbD family protein [Pseudomonas aeruginosa]|nr:CsbD family protein [Pseudomonas aeruginosa]
MTSNRLEGDWRQVRGWVKEQWGRLTDDDLMVIDGSIDRLAGRVQERYGYELDHAEREVREWNARRRDNI